MYCQCGLGTSGVARIRDAQSETDAKFGSEAEKEGCELLWTAINHLIGQSGAFFRPWMGAVIDLGQMLEVEVGVDLCRGKIGMAEQLLHRTQIAAGFQ